MDIVVKRIYDDYTEEDGTRILVDRLWPRGVKKSEAMIDSWHKDLAPSNELRKWYGHDPEKWVDFKDKYFCELRDKDEKIREMLDSCRTGRITLLYASRNTDHNQAVALKEYIERTMEKEGQEN